MSVVVVTPPDPIVDLDTAKAHLWVEHDGDDALIERLVQAATAHLDGPGGWLGRALGEQVLELRLDRFDCQPLRLPYAPVSAIGSVAYIDADGDTQTLDADAYQLLSEGRLWRPFATYWPSTRCEPDAVTIQYTAGWPFDENDVWTGPEPIRAAILLMVSDLYANRQAQVIEAGSATQILNPTAAALLGPFRIWFL